MRGRSGGAFLGKGLLMALLLLVPFYCFCEGVRVFLPWKPAQDRLNQIQWNAPEPGCRMALLGDSVFNSQVGGDPPRTVWNRLGHYVGVDVFPATFSGARPLDILNGARWLAAQDLAPGAVVFIDIHPMRLMLAPGPPGGIYHKWAWVAVPPEWNPSVSGLERVLTYYYTRPFFLLTHPPVWEAFVNASLNLDAEKRKPNDGAVIWWERPNTNFPNLQEEMEKNGPRLIPEYLQLYDRTQTILREKGCRPIIVCTPFNRAMVEKSCTLEKAREIFAQVNETRNRLIAHLKQKGFEYVDLTEALPSEAFADVLHPNAVGNDRLARALSEWLKQNPAPSPAGE
ncbi:MAG TPA: hypothetical protein PLA90_08555 [Candidatus Sumerlaeota bacterium]|nr:hypothetical protein [Candidatus Sumerlaeota bacterium]